MNLVAIISKVPWMLFVIGYLIIAELMMLPLEGLYGYIFVGCTVVILFVEMFKAMDLTPKGFFWDQAWAIICVVLATGLLTYLIFTEGRSPSFYHWLAYGVILADAIINPLNAFRSALRNFDVGK